MDKASHTGSEAAPVGEASEPSEGTPEKTAENAADASGQPPGDPGQATPPAAGGTGAGADIGAELAALKQQMDDLKQEMETQKLMMESGSGGQEVKQEVVRLYGWADMGINKTWITDRDSILMVLPTRATTFVLGGVNLYFDIQPSEDWSALVETRFTNIPVGYEAAGMPMLGTEFDRPTSQSIDTSSPVVWSMLTNGYVIMERAYIQYRYNDQLQLRVGKFLTPLGIWNVDHGVPTLISLALPVFMIQSIFPRAQIGVQVLGNKRFGAWDLGYTLYASNGRNATEHLDPTDDKMFGGRITARTSRPYRMQFGLSGLTGRYSDMQRNVVSFAPSEVEYTELEAYRETTVGADLSLDLGSLRIRSEMLRTQKVYATGKRPMDYNAKSMGAVVADSVVMDWYLLAAYRLPWLNLEPYFYYEWFKWPQGMGEGYMGVSGGLNIYFTPFAQLKMQYIQHFYFFDLWDFDRNKDYDKKIFTARLVLGF